MPDPIARKRLKKKMLDRWENEGGRIAADSKPTREKEGKRKQLSTSGDNTPVGGPASPTKKRRATEK